MFSCFLFSACYGVYQKEGKKKNFPYQVGYEPEAVLI
jgi:hypothetical protein